MLSARRFTFCLCQKRIIDKLAKFCITAMLLYMVIRGFYSGLPVSLQKEGFLNFLYMIVIIKIKKYIISYMHKYKLLQ